MRKFAPLLLLLITTNLFAQVKAPETDFILQYGKVFWQHSYNAEGKTAAEISTLLETKFATGLNQSNFFKSEKIISFNVQDDKPVLKKYGAKETSTSIIAQLYMKYSVKIDIDNGMYKVTIKDIFMDNKDATERKSGEIMKFVCNTSNLTFKEDSAIKKGLFYDHLHLLEKFNVVDPTTNN